MKKFIVIVLAIGVLCCSFAGCNSDSGKTPVKPTVAAFSGTAQEVLDLVVAKANTLDTDKEYGMATIECTDTPVDEDGCTDILGLTTEEFTSKIDSAIESQPDGSWYTHSVVVIKVKADVDVATLAKKIVAETKPDRFGCLKPPMIVGAYAGEYICFAASEVTSCEAVYAAFKELSAVEPTRIDRENDWSGGDFFG